MAPIDLTKLQTEARNSRSANIDELSSLEICQVINHEDAAVPATVTQCLTVIAAAVDALAERVRHGGRVIYVGAGTSGR
jgi:N-acetylmuramic acid 6-phosphate etherase